MDFGKIISASWIAIVLMLILTIGSNAMNYMPIGMASTCLGQVVFILAIGISVWLGYNCVKTFGLEEKEVMEAAALLGVINGIVTLGLELNRTQGRISQGALVPSKLMETALFYIALGIGGALLGVGASLIGAKLARGGKKQR